MIAGLDHFIILVNDLAAAIETYRRLGFDTQAGGEHPAFGSHNALAVLEDGTYLELVAFRDTVLAAKTFWGEAVKKLRVREGFDRFAVRSDDIAADVLRIRNRGVDIEDPQPGARRRPDGQSVAWRVARASKPLTTVLPFLIQDDTPRELRVPPAGEGLGRRLSIKEVVVGVSNLEAARGAYRDMFETEPRPVQNTAGDVQGYRVPGAWGSIVLAHPERKGNALADQLAQRGEGVYALTFVVDDLARAQSEMQAAGIRVENEPNGFLIAPDAACGARLRLVEA